MTDFLVKRFIRNSEQIGDPAVRERYGVLSGVVGIVLNLLLSAGKLFAGVLTASISITADAFNNLSDAGSSVATLVGFKLAGQKADEDHPFGHGRMEYLAGLLVSLVIMLVGVELAKSSVEKIMHPETVYFSPVSVVILSVSILAKLWMGGFNRRLATRIDSAAMRATAADSLSDAVATSAVLAGALVGRLTGRSVDGWVGVIVAVFILRTGWGAAKDTLNPLLGQKPDPVLVCAIRDTVLAHKQVVGLHDLVIHDYGPGRSMMSLHAEIPLDSDIMEAHDVIDGIERELYQKFGIQTSIHMDPIAVNDDRVNAMRARVLELVQTLDPGMTIHDFRMTEGPHHTNLIFDVVLPAGCAMDEETVRENIREQVRALDSRYFAVVQVERAYADLL